MTRGEDFGYLAEEKSRPQEFRFRRMQTCGLDVSGDAVVVRCSSEPRSIAGFRNHARLSDKVASGIALPGRGVRARASERLGVGSGAPRLRNASRLCRLI